jgi:hypothetical protein
MQNSLSPQSLILHNNREIQMLEKGKAKEEGK